VPRLAVIGFPVGHSRSPAMQNAALAELGLGDWEYGAIEVEPAGFEAKVRELAADGYAGLNVTVPHKEAALAMAEEASPAAAAIGAANTLSFRPDHTAVDDVDSLPWIAAENTDAGGLLAALPQGAAAEGARALVLGAGGAARAAIWALSQEGAEVEVWNRTAERGRRVAAELGVAAVDAPEGGAYGLIVNTTAVGLRGEDTFAHLPLAATDFTAGQTVVDMVYGERPSGLLEAATAAGAETVDGLEILVRQGALSLAAWTGREAPVEVMRAAARG
jgi:shikimate dehydrogenase